MLSLSALCYVYFKTLWVDRYIHSSSLREISIINFHRAICFHGLLNLLILSKIATTALFYILGNITVLKKFCLKYRKCHWSKDLESEVHGIGSWGLDSQLIFRTWSIWIDWGPRGRHSASRKRSSCRAGCWTQCHLPGCPGRGFLPEQSFWALGNLVTMWSDNSSSGDSCLTLYEKLFLYLGQLKKLSDDFNLLNFEQIQIKYASLQSKAKL